jgi:phosphoglycolate phosphatase-like HAD superfamily hydrolase
MDAIYFDLDGTLTDPKPGITRSIQYALQRLDHPTIPTEDELTSSDFPTSASMRTAFTTASSTC